MYYSSLYWLGWSIFWCLWSSEHWFQRYIYSHNSYSLVYPFIWCL